MKIAIAQLNSTDDIEKNFQVIKELILKAVAEKPEIIFFPENSLFFRIQSETALTALTLEDKFITELEKTASKTEIALHLTTAILDNDGKVFNASILIRPNQRADILYKKIHLFDIELNGQKSIRESDSFVAGLKDSIFEFNGFKFGSSICYDLRFAELYHKYAMKEVDAILIPAAFLVKTGQAHWEILTRARAIESQCYVLAAAQSGLHKSISSNATRETYGHSIVVDPWGKIQALKVDGVGLVYAELDKSEIQSVRRQIPMKNHRRL